MCRHRHHEGEVIAGAAVDQVVASAADEEVVAGAAIQGQCDLAGGERTGVDHVGAAEAIDRKLIGRIGAQQVHFRVQAVNHDPARIGGDRDRVGPVGAVDGHAVDLSVAGVSAGAREMDIDLGDIGPSDH
jgi:hypothetical protein